MQLANILKFFSNRFNLDQWKPGEVAIVLGIILVVQGYFFMAIIPNLFNYQGLEPEGKISIAHSEHFRYVSTKLNFITNEDSDKVSIYYSASPIDKHGFLAIVLPYDGILQLHNKTWYSTPLTSTSTLLFTNVTCCVSEEDEFQFLIKGKLDSFKIPNHYIHLPFSNGASKEAVDEFYKIANGTTYRIGWDATSTSVQLSLNKEFDERITEPVARLNLVPNKILGGNNFVLNWNLDNGDTVFTAQYSRSQDRNFAEFRQLWIAIGFGAGVTMIAAGVALKRNEDAIQNLKNFVQIQRHMQDANTAFTLKNYELAKQSYDLASKINKKAVDPLLLAGNSFYEMRFYDEAISYYEKVLKIDPNHIAALNNIGVCKAGLEKLDEAFEYYERVLGIKPDHKDSINNLGDVILDFGLPECAEPYFDEVLKIDKNDVVALRNKARVMDEIGKHDKSLQICNNALKIKPNDIHTLIQKTVALSHLDNPEEIITCCNIVLKTEPNNPQAIFNKSIALVNLEKYDEANSLIDEYLVRYPNYLPALKLKSQCLNGFGLESKNKTHANEYFKQALEYLEKALIIEPDDPETLNNKAIIIGKLGNPEESLKIIEQLLMKQPQNIEILMNKAAALTDLDEKVEAINVFEDILEIDKNNNIALERKGKLLVSLEKYDEAINDCFDPLIHKSKTTIKYLISKADALRKNQKNEEAINVYDKILSLDSDDTIAINDKGLCLMNLKQYQMAIDDCFDETLKIDKKNIYAFINKGACLHHLGKYEEAITCYENVLKIEPRNSQAWYNKAWALEELGQKDEARICLGKSEKYKEIEERKNLS